MPIYRKADGWPKDKSRGNVYRQLPAAPGVYLMVFRGGPSAYVGSSVNMHDRLRSHLREMRGGKFAGGNGRYEPADVVVKILEHVDDPALLEELEKKHIKIAAKTYTLVNRIRPGRARKGAR